MKVLVICSAGIVRSVAVTYHLKDAYGYDALAAGHDKNSQETIDFLSGWADRIIVTEPKYAVGILKRHVRKIVPVELTDIGPDRWGNPLDPSLQSIVADIARKLHEKGYFKTAQEDL